MKHIQEVIPMRGSEVGLSLLIDSWRNQISQDQQYRELTQNSIESIKRVQKLNPTYPGIIRWQVDQQHFEKHKVKKLCIIDNGEGMTPEEMLENLNSLGNSTRNNEYYNHGCGAKIAGLAHNRFGLLYKSWKNGKGYVVKFMRNEMGRYGAVKIGGKCSFPISDEMKPDCIKDHGCIVTLLGDDEKEDTTLPNEKSYGLLKGTRKARSVWLAAYLNTKYFSVPNNIRITVERFGMNNTTLTIKGHEHGLGLHYEKRDEVQLTNTKVLIFFRKETRNTTTNKSNLQHYMTTSQLGIVNQGELIKLEFAGANGANPLPAWGLQCIRQHVTLVLIPEGVFKQNIERTDLICDGMRINEQLNLWKNEFKDKMPQWLKDFEAEKQKEQLDKDNDNESRLKKLAPLFKKERYYNSQTGSIDIEKSDIRKAASKKNNDTDSEDPKPNPNGDPKDEFGLIEAVFGVKVDKSKYKGKKINLINEYPNVHYVNNGPSNFIGTFIKDNYSIEVNLESNLMVELVDYLDKMFSKIIRVNIVNEVKSLIGLSLQQQVAHVYNRTDSSEEEINIALSDLCLTACAANKDYIIDRLSFKFKNYSNWKNRKKGSVTELRV